MKKLLALGAGVMMMSLFIAGCTPSQGGGTNGGETPGGNETPVINTVYEDAVLSPVCPEVDETGYTTYYFDSVSGQDSNDGTSEASPKKTLSELGKVASAAKTPTKCLLKAGSTFEGTLTVLGFEATKEKPLLIGSYGGEGYPLIRGTGGTAVHVYGGNFRISGLEITNPQGTGGIKAEPIEDGATSNIVIENCYIHEIQWNWTDPRTVEEAADDIGNINVNTVCPSGAYVYSTSGIYLWSGGQQNLGYGSPSGTSDNPRWFSDCWIRNNKIKTVGRCAIFVESTWISGNGCAWGGKNKFRSLDDGWFPSKNIVVSGNDISYVGGDGILTIGMEDCYIEYNTCLHAALLGRAGQACAGIWPINSRRVYIQFNEAGYTHLDNGCTDGEGFDIDIGCSDVIFQYNYSHDNDGGGLLICNVHAQMPVWDENGEAVLDPATGKQATFDNPGYWNNVHIRNNLFACNGQRGNNAAFLVMSSDCKNIICENNTIVITPGLSSQQVITSADYGQCGMQENLVLRNNVFYAEENQYNAIQLDCCASSVFENNLYYNFPDTFFDKWMGIEDKNAIRTVDPLIEIPGDRTGYDKVELFRPKNDKLFTMGMELASAAKTDILGKSAEKKLYLGAYCE